MLYAIISVRWFAITESCTALVASTSEQSRRFALLQVLLKHGHQPTTVLVDLPCTLFMIDNRNMSVVEDVARLLTFSPAMSVRTPPCRLY